MSPDPLKPEEIGEQRQPNVPERENTNKLVKPRPGHADLEGMLKYGFDTARNVLERASARETAARVAAGVFAKQFLRQTCGIEIESGVLQFGKAKREDFADDDEFMSKCEELALIAKEQGDTIGGVVGVTAQNVPHGLGSYTSASARLDAALAASLMSIQAFKGVEIGDGFQLASTPGTRAHDRIVWGEDGIITRATNHAGGIEGGISNGMPVVLRAAVKPIPSIPGGLATINLHTAAEDRAHSQRSDVSAVFPASIVAGSMMALTLADFVCQKFGSDSVEEIACNFASTQQRIAKVLENGAPRKSAIENEAAV
jgi:chorismate synthase